MKTKIITTVSLLFANILFSANITAQPCMRMTTNSTGDSSNMATTLSEEEIKGILFMREEEKLARDVYLELNEIFPLRPFQNISKSEQAHMDAIKFIIDSYGLENPVQSDIRGKFDNKELQALYDQLIERGKKSKIEALRVGALIEEVDIIDLQNELDMHVTNPDIIRVYSNLIRGSENHLRAFVRVLGFNDVDYNPVKLDQDAFVSIIASSY